MTESIPTIEVACPACTSDRPTTLAWARDFAYATCSNEFEYVRCGACGQVYLHNRPTLDQLSRIYPTDYSAYDYEAFVGGFVNRLRQRVQRTKIAPIAGHAGPADTIVDVGCGGGELLGLLARHGDPSWKLYGVDISSEAIAALERRGITGVQGRFETMEWPHEQPSVIVMNQMIEHFEDPRRVISRAREALKPGGVLIMETPSLEGWDAQLFEKRHWGGWHAPRHWAVFDEQTLGRMVREEGLLVDGVEYVLSAYNWLHSFQYWIADRWSLPRLARHSDVHNVAGLCLVAAIDVVQRAVRGRTSNMRLVARKP